MHTLAKRLLDTCNGSKFQLEIPVRNVFLHNKEKWLTNIIIFACRVISSNEASVSIAFHHYSEFDLNISCKSYSFRIFDWLINMLKLDVWSPAEHHHFMHPLLFNRILLDAHTLYFIYEAMGVETVQDLYKRVLIQTQHHHSTSVNFMGNGLLPPVLARQAEYACLRVVCVNN